MTPQAGQIQRLVDELNPEQRRAVLHEGGPLLVLAGAGTGKTRVITVRIAHLVAQGTPAERVLALTFTNKAAGEMRERVAGFVGDEAAKAMTLSTFHSLGLRMIERDAKRLGFRRGVTLMDGADQARAIRACLKRLRIDPKRHDPRSFLTAISNARNAGHDPDAVAAMPGRKMTADVYRAYLEWLQAYQALDFDDLILRAIQLLREHDEVREYWRHRFAAILVDEYQDTNTAQLELLRFLSDAHRQLCVVGDDDQSIYGWRGADFRNILEFERHFPDATAIALTKNYRSTGHILSAANAIIGHNEERRAKSLWTDVGEGDPVRVVQCKDEDAEASFVAAEIRRRADSEHRPWTDFGVLVRTAAQTRPIENALRLAGVSYRLIGAYEFFERKEVKDVLSYLRVVANPHDEVNLLRIINFPQRAVGPVTIAALHRAAQSSGRRIYEVLSTLDQAGRLNARQRAGLTDLRAVIEEARQRYHQDRDIEHLARWLCERIGAREAWIRNPAEGPGGKRRWETVQQLFENMAGWMTKNPRGKLKDYLRLVTLDSRSTNQSDGNQVVLMTLHAAKGLEWPVCFVVGCQEGLIPHQRTLEDPRGDVSEERRLFYVGITRARRSAYLTSSKLRKRYSGVEPTRPSRFLREIPAAHRLDDDRGAGGGTPERAETNRRLTDLAARIAERKHKRRG